ncbi:MAG: hypothetical protein HFJ09_10740 [Lachnospiraceae bacterium]|nr:hypothetical protein [Lachnospiraceae bacterium]
MLDKSKFMEMLAAITEVAKVQENQITKEEIQEYFAGMNMEESQYQHIYQYLGENGVQIPGFVYKEYSKREEIEETKEETKEERPIALSIYMKELEEISGLSKEERTSLFLALRNKDEQAKSKLIEGYLPVVVEIARDYKDKGLPIEDLIQEGNLGLLQGLEAVSTIANIEDVDAFLQEHIKMAIAMVIDEEVGENDWETAMVAKTSLISEAAKVLAEDLGRVATVKELSDYTKIPIEEVKDILSLSLDAVKVGNDNG